MLHHCRSLVDGRPFRFFLTSFILELSRFTSLQTLEIMRFMSTIQRPQGIISCLERAWFDAHATSLSLSRRWQTLQIFLDSFIFELRRFTSFQTLKIMTFMSTIHDHKTSYHVLSKHGLVSKVHRYHCHVDGRPIRYIKVFLEGFIQHWAIDVSTFYQTLKIMMFLSTTNDHKASYHVLSEHDLAPKLHRCRCLNDGRPIRSFLKSSYWNSDVSRPFKRSKSWQIMTFMSTTNDHKASCHVLSKHDLVAKLHRCPCQVDGTPIRVFFFEGFKPELRLSTFYQTLEIMMFMSTTNDHKASYHVLSKHIFGAQATSLSLSRRWQTHQIFLKSFILELKRFTSLQTLKIMADHDVHVNDQRPRGIMSCLKQAWFGVSRFTSWHTLAIMTFMSTIHDHKASYHVLSKHDLLSMLHHRRCLVDGRPIRYFLKASYLNLDVSRPFRRSNHDVHVNDQRPQGIISCLEQAWFAAHATSLPLSRRWQTL